MYIYHTVRNSFFCLKRDCVIMMIVYLDAFMAKRHIIIEICSFPLIHHFAVIAKAEQMYMCPMLANENFKYVLATVCHCYSVMICEASQNSSLILVKLWRFTFFK